MLLFLRSGRRIVVDALRSSGGARYPLAAHVVSGLRRLPSVTGAVFSAASLRTVGHCRYEPGSILVEPTLVSATSSPLVSFEGGDVDYVIWSQTGRSVANLASGAGRNEVIFTAGTTFKVLHAAGTEHTRSGRMVVFLRELADSERPPACGQPQPPARALSELEWRDRRVLERLVAAAELRDGALTEEAMIWRAHAASLPIGLDRNGIPFAAAT
jgi:hypothetical protein